MNEIVRLTCRKCKSSINTRFIKVEQDEDNYGRDDYCFLDMFCTNCSLMHKYIIENDEDDRCIIRRFKSYLLSDVILSKNNTKV